MVEEADVDVDVPALVEFSLHSIRGRGRGRRLYSGTDPIYHVIRLTNETRDTGKKQFASLRTPALTFPFYLAIQEQVYFGTYYSLLLLSSELSSISFPLMVI